LYAGTSHTYCPWARAFDLSDGVRYALDASSCESPRAISRKRTSAGVTTVLRMESVGEAAVRTAIQWREYSLVDPAPLTLPLREMFEELDLGAQEGENVDVRPTLRRVANMNISASRLAA